MQRENMELFVQQPKRDRGQFEQPLLYIARQLEHNALQIPHFQRSFDVWGKAKQRSWFETVISGDAIGVVVTYQLDDPVSEGVYPVYLADGYQRLTATLSVMRNPRQYGLDISIRQAEAYAEAFRIIVQHRIYKTHNEAYKAFQNLNRGSAATPAEFYKGLLTSTHQGQLVYKEVPEIVARAGRSFTRAQERKGRVTIGKYIRSSLAMFYMYTTKATNLNMWKANTTTIRIDQDDPIEQHVFEWLSGITDDDLDHKIAEFAKFIDAQSALMRTVFEDEKGVGSAMTIGLFRALLSFSIYRRNTGITVAKQELLYRETFRHTERNTTTIILPGPPATSWVLNIANIGKTLGLAEKLGIEMDIPKRKRNSCAPGFDNSHIDPFSTHGDGASFPEPASLNRARGAAPVE